MATPKRQSQWVLHSSAELLAWMEDEYLSEVTLDAVRPDPGPALPPSVHFTWSLHGTGEGRVVPYTFVAEDVRQWSQTGAPESGVISITLGDLPGVHLHMAGALTLVCGALRVTRGRVVKRPRVVRPTSAYAYYVVSGDHTITLPALLDGLGAPADVSCSSTPLVQDGRIVPGTPGVIHLARAGVRWISVFSTSPVGATGGFSLSVSRHGATDAEWRRAQDLPRFLAPSRVVSAWEFDGTHDEWDAMLRAAPPS